MILNPDAMWHCRKSKIRWPWARHHAWWSSGPGWRLSGRSWWRGPEAGFLYRVGTVVRTVSSTWIYWHYEEVSPSPRWVQTWRPTQGGWRQLWASSGLHCPAQSPHVLEGWWCEPVWSLCSQPRSWPWHETTPSRVLLLLAGERMAGWMHSIHNRGFILQTCECFWDSLLICLAVALAFAGLTCTVAGTWSRH